MESSELEEMKIKLKVMAKTFSKIAIIVICVTASLHNDCKMMLLAFCLVVPQDEQENTSTVLSLMRSAVTGNHPLEVS